MEAQFRRLWPRRKSLKKSTRPDITEVPTIPLRSGFEYNTSYEATVSGPAPQVGTLPLKPSDNAKPRKSFGHSKAQSAGVRDFRTVTGKDTHSRATSTGGIKPILVGISRPIASGSTQKDGMEAGNVKGNTASSTAVPRLNTAGGLSEPRKAQRFQTAPRRHVDIMSFAAATGKHLEDYNEEVAERNLDLKALANESATTTYVPKLRYQEEVATHNAASMGYRYKASAPMRSVPEGRRSNSLDSKGALKASSLTAPPPYKHEGSAAPAKMMSMQDSVAYHSRIGSLTTKNSNPLPGIPQEHFVQEAERMIPGLDSQNRAEARQRVEQAAEPGTSFTRYPSMHGDGILGDSSQTPSFPAQKLTTRANESRLIANGNPREHVHPLYSNPYQAPVAEYMTSEKWNGETRNEEPTTRGAGSRSSRYYGDETSNTPAISSSRTSSADRRGLPSSLNQRRDMSNRTFMDLSEDEPENLGQIESPNTEYLESPLLAHATADMLQFRRPPIVASNGNHASDEATLPDTMDHGTSRTRSLRAPSRQSKRWSGAYSDAGSFSQEQLLAFSAVTTLSSMPPASRPISKFSPAAELSRSAISRERTSQSSMSRRAPFPEITRPRAPAENADQTLTATSSLRSRENTRAPTFYVDSSAKVSTAQQKQIEVQTPQPLYTSPESLSSGDFIDPSRSFGVMTRDFASTPSRPSRLRPEAPRQMSQPILPQEQTPTPRRHLGFEQKSSVASNSHDLPVLQEPPKSPQLDHVDTPQKELTASSFDEAEFARKQAQARAALLRLQMSLEEQYDMSPGRPDSSTQRHVARQILDQTRKTEPEEKRPSIPPTSMYYEKKDYQSKPKTRPLPLRKSSEDSVKPTSGYSYEKAGPNFFAQSVYSAVTIAPGQTTSTNGHAKSLSAGSASHSYNYANGVNNTTSRAASTLPNPPLTPVLPSPSGTEVSLSSFPMPRSPEQPQRGRMPMAEGERPRTARMHSTKSSVASIASVYSIPHHMVPRRDSSRRDQFEEEGVGAW